MMVPKEPIQCQCLELFSKKIISPFLIWHTAEMKKEEEITVDLSYQ